MRNIIVVSLLYISSGIAGAQLGANWSMLNQNGIFGPLATHSAVVFDDRIWIFGGNSEDNDTSISDDIWSSVDGIEWVLESGQAPFGPRRDHTATVFNDRIWIICGVTAVGTVATDVWSSANGLDWVQETANAGFGARLAHEALAFQDKLWVMGGVVSGQVRRDVWNSTDGENWIQVTATAGWEARHSFSATEFNNEIWVINGTSSAAGFFNDVWRSANGLQWTQVLPAGPWTPRNETQLLSHDGQMMLCGGNVSDYFWVSSNGVEWQEISINDWPNRLAHQMVLKGSRLFAIGGSGPGGLRKADIWVSDANFGRHDADSNLNSSIELSELLRVIQFYNLGGYIYCPDDLTEDGFCGP